MKREHATAAGLAAVVILIASPYAAGRGQGPAEDVICRYLEAGPPGPEANELQITITDYVGEVTVERHAEQIIVSEDAGDPLSCSDAEAPSVTNVDRISVRVSRESLDSLILDLRNGFLAPGATTEADGTAEIEFSLAQAPGTVLSVIGTSSADHVQLGSLGGGDYGANLNGAAEATPDVDVTARNAFVFLALGGGGDRVDSLGRAAFATRPFNFSFGARGGRGDDVLIGNDRRNVLDGDQGRDRLVGNGLGDQLFGGRGPDRIEAKDRARDVVDCGAGRDVAHTDRIDRRRECP